MPKWPWGKPNMHPIPLPNKLIECDATVSNCCSYGQWCAKPRADEITRQGLHVRAVGPALIRFLTQGNDSLT